MFCSLLDNVKIIQKTFCCYNFLIYRLYVPQPVYKKLLPLYYPRSEEEEKACIHLIPADIGNSEGEPIIPERQIRITEKPGILEGMQNIVSQH